MAATAPTSSAQAVAVWTELTPSERQVGAAIAQGGRTRRLPYRLALSPKTVDNRVSAIYEKLPDIPGAHRRVQTALLIRKVLGKGA